jgi:transcription initiation factor IIF auxiliary subunit
MTLRIAQSYEYQGEAWWRWAIWLDGTEEELDDVRAVTYKLHESFPNPVRRVTDRASQFRLTSGGWGVFTIYALVERRQGPSQHLEHHLQLEYPGDEEEASLQMAVEKVADGDQDDLPNIRRVFLSYNAEDTATASAIKAALQPYGIDVADAGSLAAGVPQQVALQQVMQNADAYVFLAGGGSSPGPFLTHEAEVAMRLHKPLLVVGDEDASTPKALRAMPHVPLAEIEQGLPRVLRELKR